MDWIREYFINLWVLTLEVAPYLLLGFFFAGVLNLLLKKDRVLRYLGGRGFRSVFFASLMGVPLPLCSCGVIPTGVSFHHNGASKGASVSFLISTPQTGVDSILVTYSLLGLPMAILRPIIAFVTGLFGGWLTNRVTVHEGERTIQGERGDGNGGILAALKYAFVTFLGDIALWLLVGMLLAALITTVIPPNFFASYIDTPILGMLLVLLGAIPLYVCATASVPIAAALMITGLSPGAAIVFLMAGPATNVATITVIGKALGGRSLFAYLFSIISGAMLFGIIVDYLLPRSWFLIDAIGGGDHHHGGNWLEIISAVILIGLIGNYFLGKLLRNNRDCGCGDSCETKDSCCGDHCCDEQLLEGDKMADVTIKIDGMNCNHCKMSVEKNLGKLEGIDAVVVDLGKKEAVLTGEGIDLQTVEHTLDQIGFEFKGVKS